MYATTFRRLANVGHIANLADLSTLFCHGLDCFGFFFKTDKFRNVVNCRVYDVGSATRPENFAGLIFVDFCNSPEQPNKIQHSK